jgi:putative oxidoreductase
MKSDIKSSAHTFDVTLLTVRVFLGAVVFAHGAQKLFGWFGGYGFDGTVGFFTNTIGLPYILGVLIIAAESLGMIALIVGFFSRIMSAALILIMLGAIFSMHGQFGFFMNWTGTQGGEGFEYHLLVIALSFVLVANGSGAYSLDQVLKNVRVNKLSRQTT